MARWFTSVYLFLFFVGTVGCSSHQSTPAKAAPQPPISSGPAWAHVGDSTDEAGHTFICQGVGHSEEEAVTAAHAACNDKVCKLCGVEIESVTETQETLEGVSLKRKIVERCRRVQKGQSTARYKSSECGPLGCVAFIQIFFSKTDEENECPVLTRDSFSDPAECERLIETFRNTVGLDAKTFATRQKTLDDAWVACENIDERPTPLLLALAEQLEIGFQASLASSTKERHQHYDLILPDYPPLLQQLRESKLLTTRLQLLRDFVAHKYVLLTAYEALLVAEDLDTPVGVERLLTALHACPLDERYGVKDIRQILMAISGFYHLQINNEPVMQYLRATYPPASITHKELAMALSNTMAHDRKITEEEWRYVMKMQPPCVECFRRFLDVKNHGSPGLRQEHFFAALPLVLANTTNDEERQKAVVSLLPNDVEFILAVKPRLPKDLTKIFSWKFWVGVRKWNPYTMPEPVLKQVGEEMVTLLRQETDEYTFCKNVSDEIAFFNTYTNLKPFETRICTCLITDLQENQANSSFAYREPLYRYAVDKRLPCVMP